jgi:cytochrome c peroxidase
MRRTLGLLLVVLVAGASARADIPKPGPLAQPASSDQAGLPKDLTQAVTPHDNPTTADRVALGKKLFFDGRLSADGTVACATCHDPSKGFTDGRATSVGIKKQVGHRNAPTVLNALYNDTQFWDGRAHLLEDQAKLPITNPIEMGQPNLDAAVAAVANIAEYRDAFTKVFSRAPNGDDLARAIAAYERTQIAFDAPFDRFLAGDENALDKSARRGWALFNGRGRCMSCHGMNATQPTFSDNKFHNIGVSAHKSNFVDLARKAMVMVDSGNPKEVDRAALETDLSELGRFLVTKNGADLGAFKTSTLRNVVITPPYFHDGSQDTLWDVLDHYNKGGVQNPFLDGGIQRLGLSESEIDDLVAFLASLTSDRFAALGKKELARQRALRGKRPQRDTAAALGQKAQKGLVGPFGDAVPPQTLRDPATIGGR